MCLALPLSLTCVKEPSWKVVKGMMSLIIVVISIALTAMFFFSGISYFGSDLNVKVEMSHIVNAHYETMVMALNNYRLTNHGMMPSDANELDVYLPGGKKPQFPKFDSSSQPYEWSVNGDYLCLFRTTSNEKYAGVDKGVHSFIVNHSKQSDVKVSSNCSTAVSGSTTTKNIDFTEDYIIARNAIAFAFKVN